MINPGDRVCLDTNILLDATDEGRKLHAKAFSTIASLASRADAHLFVATQVLREYLVVASRPAKNNGLGLAVADAVRNVREFRKQAALIFESEESCNLLLDWAIMYQVSGRKLHDLQILATAAHAQMDVFLTTNTADFPNDAGLRIVALEGLTFIQPED